MAGIKLKLELLANSYAICRLAPDEAIPAWATRGDFFSISKSHAELSIVCAQNQVPADVCSEKDWRLIMVKGPLDFGLTGILASLTQPLADAHLSIFAVSTFDTDYLLLKAANLEPALRVLTQAGHELL